MRNDAVTSKIDWWIILIYIGLATIGLLTIYAAVFDAEHPAIYDLATNYGRQFLWLTISLAAGMILLLINARFFNNVAYIIYGFAILLLMATLVIGSTVAGSKSWINLGFMSFQPSEFAKFATALALAHYLDKIDRDFNKTRTQLTAYAIVLIPMILVLLQGDAGSALVFSVFLLVFYKEGMSGRILVIGLAAVAIFILTLLTGKATVIIGIIAICGIILIFTKKRKENFWKIFGIAALVIIFSLSVDFIFDNVLKQHQQTRIKIILGLEDDPLGVGYNLRQSKIAIGSGGFCGKGFLHGTMTKYDFVPEHHTDFIFCTIAEEQGFVGVVLLFAVYVTLMIRLVIMANRQRSTFSRIYGYSIASILFFHFFVNIGMTIGLLPVIGIPLPFMSYGGSSLFFFSLMLFVFIKQDANRKDIL